MRLKRTKRKTVNISELARYASAPDSLLNAPDKAATQYGIRAHEALGRRKTYLGFKFVVLIAAVVLAVGVYVVLGGQS